MATAEQILSFRRAAAIELDDAVYTDAVIDGMIEDLGFNPAVGQVWREKAASFAGLVDTTESGSSRRLSQLYSQALAVGSAWTTDPSADDSGGSFTVEIERM